MTPPPRCAQAQPLSAGQFMQRRSGCERCVLSTSSTSDWRCMPAVIIAGTQKGGTTELSWNLRRHHQLFADDKESHFFDIVKADDVLDPSVWHDYLWPAQHTTTQQCGSAQECSRRSSHEGAWGSRAILSGHAFAFEKTPDYLRTPHAMDAMLRLLPSVRVLVLLREPTARAYSQFRMNLVKDHPHANASTLALAPELFETRISREVAGRCLHLALTMPGLLSIRPFSGDTRAALAAALAAGPSDECRQLLGRLQYGRPAARELYTLDTLRVESPLTRTYLELPILVHGLYLPMLERVYARRLHPRTHDEPRTPSPSSALCTDLRHSR